MGSSQSRRVGAREGHSSAPAARGARAASAGGAAAPRAPPGAYRATDSSTRQLGALYDGGRPPQGPAQPQAQQGGDSQRQAAPQEQAGAGGVSDTRTVVNHVNLDKRSVRVYRRGSRVRVAFAFDATRPCEVSVLWLAREDADAACATQAAASFRRAFPGALGQRFGDSGRGGGSDDEALYAPEEGGLDLGVVPGGVGALPSSSNGDRVALILRIEVLEGDKGEQQADKENKPPPGAALPVWKQSQMTYVAFDLGDGEGKDGAVAASVERQKIWVEGTQYELQEIYGMETTAAAGQQGTAGSGAAAGRTLDHVAMDDANECVICLSEPRNTTVMPCRHMCLCRDCADILRYQDGSKCPVCRAPVVQLLVIETEANTAAGGEGSATK